jgi:hypothetical protein
MMTLKELIKELQRLEDENPDNKNKEVLVDGSWEDEVCFVKEVRITPRYIFITRE